MATIPASAIADAHASISTSDINNGDGREQIVVNELLKMKLKVKKRHCWRKCMIVIES